MTDANSFDKSHTVSGLARKLAEMQTLRREAYATIKALDRDIAAVAAAMRVFDPESYVARAVAVKRDKRRPKRARRAVLDILREAQEPMTSQQIADEWMALECAEDTPAVRRDYRARARATLTNARVSGLTESEQVEGGIMLWRLSDHG